MKANIILIAIICFSVVQGTSQDKTRDRLSELLDSFQKNIAHGLDLTAFDSVSDPKIKRARIDAFINLCKGKGAVAQSRATSEIVNKEKASNNLLSDKEILAIAFQKYKFEIPELKDSYLEYIQSKVIVK